MVVNAFHRLKKVLFAVPDKYLSLLGYIQAFDRRLDDAVVVGVLVEVPLLLLLLVVVLLRIVVGRNVEC